MKIATITVRVLLGFLYFFSGLNAFLHLSPMPVFDNKAGLFMQGLAAAGYFFPFLKIVEMLSGVLLMSGRYTTLAIAVLFPVTLNIALFHLFLHPSGAPMGVAMLVANLFLAYSYRDKYVPLLKAQ